MLKAFKASPGVLTAVLILCALGALIYSNTLKAQFQYDDEYNIIKNSNIRDLSDLRSVWDFWPTRFLTYLSIALNYHFGKLDVSGYHVFNIFVHLACSIMVWWLTLLIFSTPAMKKAPGLKWSRQIAFFTGLLFVAHPLQTEAVTYIIQRCTSLAALFYLAALCLFLKSRILMIEGRGIKTYGPYYAASLFCALASFFTKEMTITLPFSVLLCECLFLKNEKGVSWKALLPFIFLLSVIPLTFILTKTADWRSMYRLAEPRPQISPMQYLLTEFRVINTYLRLLFLPVNQNIDYDYPAYKTMMELPVLLSLTVILSILYSAIRLFRKEKLLSFSIFWFFLTLLPESSIIPIHDYIFEHRLYLPIAAFSIFLVYAVYLILGRKNNFKPAFILGLIILAFGSLTFRRNFIWKDNFSLSSDAIKKSPDKARPYTGRGAAYAKQGEYKLALADYDKGLMLYYKQLGITADYNGIYNEILASGSGYPGIFNFLSVKYAEINLFKTAITVASIAVKIDPSNSDAFALLCSFYGNIKKYQEAVNTGREAVSLGPDSALAHYNLAVALFFNGQSAEAALELARSRDLGMEPDPGFIRIMKQKPM